MLMLFLTVLLLFPDLAQAALLTSSGWQTVAGTEFENSCASPEPPGVEGCAALFDDWCGAATDQKNAEMYVWCGGHAGSADNSVHKLTDLDGDNPRWLLLTQPSSPVRDGPSNGGTYADGKPAARHVYDHMWWDDELPGFGVWGGSQWQNGDMSTQTWMWNKNTLAFTLMSSTNGPSANFNRGCQKDPNTRLVYCVDDFALRSFNYDTSYTATNQWTKRSVDVGMSDYKNSQIDPDQQRFYFTITGQTNTLYYYNLANPTETNKTRQSITMTGSNCSWLGNEEVAWTYDTYQNKHILWTGTTAVITMDTTTSPPSCTSSTPAGTAPPLHSVVGGGTARQSGNGTFERWQYIEKYNGILSCNFIDVPCSFLRMTAVLGAADQDWVNRKNAVGVIQAEDFDTAGAFNTGDYQGISGILAGTSTTPSLDTTEKASGQGSAKFVIPTNSGPNSAGSFVKPFTKSFGPGSHFYIQYRFFLSPEMLSNGSSFGGNGWKISIVHNRRATCANKEITANNQSYRGFPIIYGNCGQEVTEFTSPTQGVILQYHRPYPAFNTDSGTDPWCRHSLLPATTRCFVFEDGLWLTMYFDITVGTFGQANSTVIGKIALPGDPYTTFINKTNFTIGSDGQPSEGFDYLTILPYDTNKNAGASHSQAQINYDEVIISTQPIIAPGVAAPPVMIAPTDLEVDK